MDFFTQKRKNGNKIRSHFIKIEITIHTFFIIILILAIIFIASGMMLSSKYLIPGDSWRSISYAANYIGKPNTSQYDKFYTSTIYWSYFIFSVSSLCGMPYVNTYVLMLPLISLFISAVYLLSKILINKPNKLYAIFSTILITTYSSLFYFTNSYLGKDNMSAFIFDGIINFRYKSFAIILALLSFSLFLISLKECNIYSNSIIKSKIHYGILMLSAWFLIQSIMIYFIPIIPVISFISFICVYSKNKEHDIRHFIYFLLFLLLFFVIFDLMMTNFFSKVLTTYFGYFFGINLTPLRTELLSNGLLIYSIISLFILMLFLFYKIYLKKFRIRMKKYHKSKAVILFIIILYSVFILFELELFFNIILRKEQNFFFFYIHLLFTKIGAVGIIGIFLSYFSFKRNKNLFYNIISWLSFIILFASIIIIIRWIQYPNLSPYSIPNDEYFYMNYWFDRIWYYSIIPLSLLTAIGLISSIQYMKKINFFIKINRNVKFIIHFALTSFLLVLILSNTIIAGMDWYNKNWYIKDDEAQIIGWVSENIPQKSNLLIDGGNFDRNTYEMSRSTTYWIHHELIKALTNDNNSFYGDVIREIYDNCELTLLKEQDNSKNTIQFLDNNSNGYIDVEITLTSERNYGSFEFNIKTSDSSKIFWINFNSISPISNGISFPIYSNGFYYYNSTDYVKIMDIENNKWYNYKVDFDCTDNNYTGLSKYHWRTTINGTVYGDFPFWNNVSSLGQLDLRSHHGHSNWSTYIKGLEFSWLSGFEVQKLIFKYLIFIDHLELKNMSYYIHTKEINYIKNIVEQYLSIENELIPYFYNEKLYEYGDIIIYRS